jgi:hypothetical protein
LKKGAKISFIENDFTIYLRNNFYLTRQIPAIGAQGQNERRHAIKAVFLSIMKD